MSRTIAQKAQRGTGPQVQSLWLIHSILDYHRISPRRHAVGGAMSTGRQPDSERWSVAVLLPVASLRGRFQMSTHKRTINFSLCTRGSVSFWTSCRGGHFLPQGAGREKFASVGLSRKYVDSMGSVLHQPRLESEIVQFV